MNVTEQELREQVIEPTLKYLGVWSPETEHFLLNAVSNAPQLGLFCSRKGALGIFNITSQQHREIWDKFLAFNPDLASRIRGLASQRAFLSDPDSELQTNLSYCTAIAWLLYERSNLNKADPVKAKAAVRAAGA